uniref:Ankyrin repeat and LEM domain-containing protein 1 n=1 Tax=Ditylenchus dipsaci TaxID=166011 RepID=A0A915EQW9_9BILA
MIFADAPYLLHLLAGSTNISALDAVKALLDNGSHDVNEREPVDNLSALHIAAAWDNLAMCQLLIHYGADLKSLDIDNRRPVDIACGGSRKLLKKLKRNKNQERRRFAKIFSFLFGKNRMEPTGCPTSAVVSCEPSSNLPATVVEITNAVEDPRRQNEGDQRSSTATFETALTDIYNFPKRNTSSQTAENEFLTMDNTRASVDSQCNSVEDVVDEQKSREEFLLTEEFSKMDINHLREELKKKNFQVGPIDARNRKLYERKLAKLEVSAKSGSDISANRYSKSLQQVILDDESGSQVTSRMGEFEEHIIRNQYILSAGKNEVSFFCYLLLDPSMLSNATSCDLRQFVSAIFYVGKGKHSRPLQHLIDANKCRSLLSNKSYQPTEKLNRILQLWNSAEALVREGSMIEAIGIENLTNVRKGNFKGLPNAWTRKQIEEFGSMLLRKAHVIYRNERCRPLFEADIAV